LARVLVIGIDGGTFDIIKPLVREGKLPNFKALMEGGSFGPLRTTIPPMTFPAWNAFMTGVNPGKHGVYDFTERIPGAYKIQFINGRSRKATTIWRMASEAGKRVGVMAVPVTYPPEKLNGFMISGFDAPGVDAHGDSSSMNPPALYHELKENVGDYIISSNIIKEVDAGRADLAIDIVLKTLGRKADTAKYLYGKEPWDLFMVLFGESDLVGHHYWKYTDRRSPFYPAKAPEKCRKAIELVYGKIDQTIGELLAMRHPDTITLLMSDHGFGGSGDRVMHLNMWLESQGFLKFKAEETSGRIKTLFRDIFFTRPLMFAKRYGIKYLPTKVKQEIFRNRTEIANNMESWLRFSRMKWNETTAYSEETPYYPTIWLNLKGREPEGIVPQAERDIVLDKIIAALYQWRDPWSGEKVVKRAYKREELYSGPHLHKAPDLILDFNYPGGFSYLSRPSYTNKGKEVIKRLSGKEMESMKFHNKSGSHRDYGIFFAIGKGIRAAHEVKDTHILDLAPTILTILGLPVPADMDGNIIEACFRPESRPVRIKRTEEEARPPDNRNKGAEDFAATYSDKETGEIRKRLQEMGYME
jgi:predicted AlkP superfamily phosphohydrolase/phosphomutase